MIYTTSYGGYECSLDLELHIATSEYSGPSLPIISETASKLVLSDDKCNQLQIGHKQDKISTHENVAALLIT